MLADCHIHMILDGQYWKSAIERHAQAPDRSWILEILQGYKDCGFTYLRDGGDRWGAGKMARELSKDMGICYRTPLAPLCKKGHYGAFIGQTYENFQEYAQLVKKAREDGADCIKIRISGLMDFDRYGVLTEEGFPEEEIFQLVHIAHEEGFAVMAHANGAKCVTAAAMAGVDSVEHGAYLDEESLWAMKEAGTVWVPTLSTVGNLRGKGRFSEEAVEKILESAEENVARFGAIGGVIAPGSDAGAWAVPHGCMTEQALLEKCLGEGAEGILQKGTKAIIDKF